ncbi:hypothetical protein [Rhodococcus erythropolis]|uniref:hypothetical protein n=1 Tax=Rhodococcus erythropolis TaxID=1833 RepID=UPI00398243DF
MDAVFDGVVVVALVESGSDGGGDGAGASGGSADVGEGPAMLRRRRSYSLRLVLFVPNSRCTGLVQPAKSHWWQSTASSALDHPNRGMTPCSSW